MEERGLRNNYIFALIKLVLFLIIFCFLSAVTKQLWQELRSKDNFDISVLVFSTLFTFAFYTFLVDLNGFYKKIQNFFFRSSFIALLFPSILILLAIGYFFIPKVLNFAFDKDIFVFLGGFSLTMHLIFIARQTKGHSFAAVINYLFMGSILYILDLALFGVYLRIGYKVQIGKVMLEGIKGGAGLIYNIFTQALR